MNLIEKLETSVSLPVLGDDSSIAHISLLEQFYAVMIARLSIPQAYTQLLQLSHQQADHSLTNDTNTSSLFKHIWPDERQRRLIIDELTMTHHIDKLSTQQLLDDATALVYHELKGMADGQFLPAFLQQQQAIIRQYLPVWSDSVVLDLVDTNEGNNSGYSGNTDLLKTNSSDTDILKTNLNDEFATTDEKIKLSKRLPESTAATDNPNNNDSHNNNRNNNNNHSAMATDSLLGSIDDSSMDTSSSILSSLTPIATSEIPDDIHSRVDSADNVINNNVVNNYAATRKRSRPKSNLLWVFLLLGAVAVLSLVWIMVIEPKYRTVDQPVVVETPPVVAPVAVAPVMTPISLTVAVDNSGSLYTCTASVGDAALQGVLQDALTLSFGAQANICELKVQEGIADNLADIDSRLLPNIFTMLKSAPFARMQLQSNAMTLEAPDSAYLQRLVTDMQAMLPSTTITTPAPLIATDSNQMPMNQMPMNQNNTNFNDDYGSGINQEFLNNLDRPQAPNINSDDRFNNGFNNGVNNNLNNPNRSSNINNPITNNNGVVSNNSRNVNPNNINTNNRNAGSLSESDADNLANSIFVAEQLENESRVERNIVPNNQ